jgi:PAS domain S-box-containing protein
VTPFKQRVILRNPRVSTFVLIAGVALSVLGAAASHLYQVRQSQARMEVEATICREDLDATFQAYRDILLGFRGHSTATLGLTRERFRQYFEALDLRTRHPGLLAVSYGLDLPGADRETFERDFRGELGDPSFTIRPPGSRPRHFVLLFAEPRESNQSSMGMDTRTLPGQAETIDQARDSGTLVVTGPMKVLQYAGPDPGLLMRLPLYHGAPSTLEERRSSFQGCITGVFRAQDLVAEALGREILKKLDVFIEDAGPASGAGSPTRLFGTPLPSGGRHMDTTVDLGGRTWRLHLRARPEWLGHQEWGMPAGFLFSGTLITLLLWSLMRSVTRTGQRARLMANQMMEQLRKERSRTEAMAEAVPDPLAILDEEGRFLQFNGRNEWFEGTSASGLLGTTVDAALPPEAAQPIHAAVAKALETRKLQTAWFELATPEGRRFYECRFLRMGERIGGKRCVVLSLRDITERTRAEEELRTRQKMESLGLLAGGIAHDFNNFLSAIQGHINLAQETLEEDAKAVPMLKRAETSVQRAGELAHQLLAYSGKGSLKVDPLDLNLVVAEMTELLGVSVGRKATLSFRLDPALPWIMADAVQIQQVVMNLVTNASDAIGEGCGAITLETQRLEAGAALLEERFQGQGLEPGTYALLRVVDTGCGMDAETRKRIFDPFFTTKAAGRGLGLSALLGILRGHGAGLHLRSEPGQGSEFDIVFPQALPPAQDPL